MSIYPPAIPPIYITGFGFYMFDSLSRSLSLALALSLDDME
jgi:hypothetical protein